MFLLCSSCNSYLCQLEFALRRKEFASNRVDKGDLKEKKPDKGGSMLECFQHKQSIKGWFRPGWRANLHDKKPSWPRTLFPHWYHWAPISVVWGTLDIPSPRYPQWVNFSLLRLKSQPTVYTFSLCCLEGKTCRLGIKGCPGGWDHFLSVM